MVLRLGSEMAKSAPGLKTAAHGNASTAQIQKAQGSCPVVLEQSCHGDRHHCRYCRYCRHCRHRHHANQQHGHTGKPYPDSSQPCHDTGIPVTGFNRSGNLSSNA